MHHYIALAWATNDMRAAREARRVRETLLQSRGLCWRTVLDVDGLSVCAKSPVDAAMCTYVLADNLGVIVGRLFIQDQASTPVRSAELPSAKIVETNGNWLLEHYWGRYVAVLRGPKGDRYSVLRDCSGQIPCFYANLNGLYVFFADVCDLEHLDLRVTLNERYLAAFISRQPLHVRETGLREITELLAGDCVTIEATGACHTHMWNPRSIVANRTMDNYVQARTALTGLTENVIAAWARFYRRILLSISGGLDSAIVLGCLKRLGLADRVVCVTQYTVDTSDDERLYARSAARMAGVSLTELPRVSDGVLFAEKLRRVPPDPKPDISKTNRILALDGLNALAEEFGCDALWTGQGGDQIFLQAHHGYGAADYLLQHRHPWRLPNMIYESALLSRNSVWSILSQAICYRFRKGRAPPVVLGGRGARFLAKSAIPAYSEDSLAIPWRVGAERIPPGKLDQLDILLDLLNRHKPIVGLERPYEQHPLISQPLIELSLQIPTYHLLRGGRQRAMARDAFVDRVPPSIIMREDKGGINDQVRSLLRGSAPYIIESLMDGSLVSLGILDRSSLEGILCHEETFTKDEQFPLFACIAAEAWAQNWRSKPAPSAAAHN